MSNIGSFNLSSCFLSATMVFREGGGGGNGGRKKLKRKQTFVGISQKDKIKNLMPISSVIKRCHL